MYPQNASRTGVPAACERSLKRLRTDRIDLYLLHWRGSHPLAETVEAFEELRAAGKIRYWGVSNFDTRDMQELVRLPGGAQCASNQVLYHVGSRGIEYDLLPWCTEHKIPLMAYSPLGQGGRLLQSKALAAVAKRHNATPAQIAIAWTMRHGNVISIPKASDPAHVRENAAAGAITLSAEDLAAIDAAHPPPGRKQSLDGGLCAAFRGYPVGHTRRTRRNAWSLSWCAARRHSATQAGTIARVGTLDHYSPGRWCSGGRPVRPAVDPP